MVDERRTPEAAGEDPRRKRTAPTIDLTATDVSATQSAPAEAGTTSTSTQAEPLQQAFPKPKLPPNPATPGQSAAAEEPPASPPPPPIEPEDANNAAAPPPRGSVFAAAIGGGLIGAVLIAALAGGLWYAGYIPSRNAAALNDMRQHVATLEKQVDNLQRRPVPKPDTRQLEGSLAALTQRVNTIDSKITRGASTESNTTQQVAKVEKQVAALGSQISGLSKRSDELAAAAQQAQQSAAATQKAIGGLRQNVRVAEQNQAPSIAPDQFAALQKRVAALDQALQKANGEIEGTQKQLTNVQSEAKAAQSKLGQIAATGDATRLALSATSLRDAVLSGAPFVPELAQAKSLAPDPKALAPLDQFAQSGVPSAERLARALRRLIPDLRKATGAEAPSGSFLDRLQANASRLVRITPVATPSGNDPAAVLDRLDHEAAQANIDGALADIAKLPGKMRVLAQGWTAKVKAREAALGAARQFAVQSARALGNQ